MVKRFLGNCLLNDMISRILNSDSQFFKKIVVWMLISFSLIIFSLMSVVSFFNVKRLFGSNQKPVSKIRPAH